MSSDIEWAADFLKSNAPIMGWPEGPWHRQAGFEACQNVIKAAWAAGPKAHRLAAIAFGHVRRAQKAVLRMVYAQHDTESVAWDQAMLDLQSAAIMAEPAMIALAEELEAQLL
ncbi:MAG: hypothetical protein WC184_12830 [Acidimicrobiia bacterium]